MAKAEERMAQLGISLPPVPRAVGAYVPAVAVGGLVYTSGQLPLRDGKLVAAGKVPTDVSIADAQAAARVAVLNALAAIRSVAGSLDAVSRLVRMNVFVNSAGGFADQAKVANGASELLIEVFAEVGRHTRCAIGAAELPLNAPVEIDLIVETS